MRYRIATLALCLVWLLTTGSALAHTVRMTAVNIPPLDQGNYAAMIKSRTGMPLSITRFNIRSTDRAIVDLNGNVITTVETPFPIENGDKAVVAIEGAGLTAVSPVEMLEGRVNNGRANLSMGVNFRAAAGKYILATPTNGANTNELSGIWFLKRNAAGEASSGLYLPALPSGWQYEGWVFTSNRWVTTGKFNHPFTGYHASPDLSAPYSGTAAAPPFAGEDFLVNAPSGLVFPLNLQGRITGISIEPNPDNSAAPFGYRPLLATIPANAADHEVYTMANQGRMAPSMMMSFTR